MEEWRKILISPSTPIMNAIRIIDDGSMQIALVVAENNRLLGTVTDGDIRRGILKEISLDSPVQEIMNTNPTVVRIQDDRENILLTMKLKRLHHIPVVDEYGCVIGVETLDQLIQTSSKQENWVVLMAGGLGSRLRPLTNDCPKPLLKVGGKPILENILGNFMEYGFRRFYISVNYKAAMIEDYFGDGSRWGIEIKYIHEDKRMGTAGALGLLPEKPTQAVLVMNGDLLTKVNFEQLLDFHLENQSQATMCVREYDFQIPFGVVKVEKHRLIGIVEKPVQRFFVNAGIYVLEPEAINIIPKNIYYDMPNLFEKIIENNAETAVFPIREYWLDIGRMDDFERANCDYLELLG